ncbi:MAG: PilZ domain-containing protein [Spirochaetales bacterium]|nr:PilZ domain-containing protein [Spirochaetales bacterium]
MGIPVTRIEKEFIFKSLKGGKTILSIYGKDWELQTRIVQYNDMDVRLEILDGVVTFCKENDEAHVFFSFQNNHFTFDTRVRERSGSHIFLVQPEEIYKDSERGYRRIKIQDSLNISFLLKQQRYELNFPKIASPFAGVVPELSKDFNPASIAQLLQSFKEKMSGSVSEHKIHMMRDRRAESLEEQLMIKTCKIIWLPSTEKDIPAFNPFPKDLIVTKDDFITFQRDRDVPSYKIANLIKDFLFQKKIKGIHSLVYCPLFHEMYLVGYIYACNKDDLKQEISKELIEYIDQFSKVLSYSLKKNGYFKTELQVIETTYEAPIIDISASGLLFSHTSQELSKELDIFKELRINFRINKKELNLDSWVIRKFKDQDQFYFGVQFRKIEPDDFCYLYEFIYNKPFRPQGKYVW